MYQIQVCCAGLCVSLNHYLLCGQFRRVLLGSTIMIPCSTILIYSLAIALLFMGVLVFVRADQVVDNCVEVALRIV